MSGLGFQNSRGLVYLGGCSKSLKSEWPEQEDQSIWLSSPTPGFYPQTVGTTNTSSVPGVGKGLWGTQLLFSSPPRIRKQLWWDTISIYIITIWDLLTFKFSRPSDTTLIYFFLWWILCCDDISGPFGSSLEDKLSCWGLWVIALITVGETESWCMKWLTLK